MQILRHVIPMMLAFSGFAASTGPSEKVPGSPGAGNHMLIDDSISVSRKKVEARASAIKKFTRDRNFNQRVVFLIDMTIPSAKNRFFIYDLGKDSVIASALVSHGICYAGGEGEAQFSNRVGSGCSSLGKYRIGKSYVGQWGYSYKLHGLEESNSNAYERTVVLHSHSSIPDMETGNEIARSLGCPMVSPGFLLTLKKIINGSRDPVLLWIYQ